MKKVVARIRGGLGNQLFCYAAARRLALASDAELVVDDVSGFVRDHEYRRRYELDRFRIPARKATPGERLEPLERYRRGLLKWKSGRSPFEARRYLEEEGADFDPRLLSRKVVGTLYLDGLWQSEAYFKDVESTIREDLQIVPPSDNEILRTAEEIRASEGVALHVRWFDAPEGESRRNISAEYYRRAIALMDGRVGRRRYFLFSDRPESARERIALPPDRITVVPANRVDESPVSDLWLMSQCRHFVTANSTFSWWGAWLGGGADKVVIAPERPAAGESVRPFFIPGQLPEGWLTA